METQFAKARALSIGALFVGQGIPSKDIFCTGNVVESDPASRTADSAKVGDNTTIEIVNMPSLGALIEYMAGRGKLAESQPLPSSVLEVSTAVAYKFGLRLSMRSQPEV